MKFGQPLISTRLSGGLGGIVGATARGGVGYFRRRVKPGNPQSPAQTLVRNITATLAAAWISLTNAQRAGWRNIAGAESSGIDAFVKGNFQLHISGDPGVANAPASAALPEAQNFGTPSMSDATDIITTDIVDGYAINVYVSAPQTASRNSRQHPFRYAGFIENGDSTVALPSDHPAHGATAGKVIYVRIVEFNGTGQVAVQQTFRVTVTA